MKLLTKIQFSFILEKSVDSFALKSFMERTLQKSNITAVVKVLDANNKPVKIADVMKRELPSSVFKLTQKEL